MKKIKMILKNYPVILKVVARVYNFLTFSRKKNKGKGNKSVCKGAFLKKCKIEIMGNFNVLEVEPLTKLQNCHIFIKGNYNHIHIGRECVLNAMEIWVEDDKNQVEIGRNTWITGRSHFAVIEGTKLTIGERCLFSEEILIRTGDSHSLTDESGRRINAADSVEVGNHVWLGYRVTLLKGSSLGNDSVVGTGAIVTEKFDDNVVLAGIPAKVIKRKIGWDSERL